MHKSHAQKVAPVKRPSSNRQLLQGRWQASNDPTNFLEFKGNHRREKSEGVTDWSDEVFVLADRCLNDQNKDGDTPAERDRYISCTQSDLCWYIVKVTRGSLVLSYMGRGNTLTYRRVK